MNEDVKKNLRTQGKYSDRGNPKNRDKRQKESPVDKEPPGKKSHPNKRDSNGARDPNNSLTDASETVSPLRYEEGSEHKFSELEVKEPREIKSSGSHIISNTFNGISSILYEPTFIDLDEGNELYDDLWDSTNWSDQNIVIRGQEYPQPRLVAWYGPFPYSYSGVMLTPAEMPECILAIKNRVEEFLEKENIKVTLNSVLLNYYRDGKDSVAWHSDDELTMGICPTIASVSLGETRKFEMRRKPQSYEEEVSIDDVETLFLNLTHGSLLVMNGETQVDWQHRVPKEYHDKTGRINLTFRTVYSLDKSPSSLPFKDNKSKLVGSNSSEKSSSAKLIFDLDDENFPPLGSSSNTSEKIPPPEKPYVSDPFSVTEDTDKSMDSIGSGSSNKSMAHSVPPIPFSSPLVNNLNEEVNIKHMYDKNVNASDSFASDSDMMITDDSMEKNTSYDDNSLGFTRSIDSMAPNFENAERNTNYVVTPLVSEGPVDNIIQSPHCNIEKIESNFYSVTPFVSDGIIQSTNSMNRDAIYDGTPFVSDRPVDSITLPPMSNFENKLYSDKIPTNLNVEAQEFFPNNRPTPPVDVHQENSYDHMDLQELSMVDFIILNEDRFTRYSDVVLEKVLKNIDEFKNYEKEEFEFITQLIEKSKCSFTQKLSRLRLCKIVKRSNGKYSRNSPRYQNSFQRDNFGQNELANPNQKKKHSYEEIRNQRENRSRGEGFYDENKKSPPQSERRTSQGEEYSSQHETPFNKDDGYSRKGGRNSGKFEGSSSRGGRNSNKFEVSSRDDEYGRGGRNSSKFGGPSRDDEYGRGGRNYSKFEGPSKDNEYDNKGRNSGKFEGSARDNEFASRGGRNSNKFEGQSNRDDENFSRGGRNFGRGERHSNKGSDYSRRGEEQSFRGRGFRHTNRRAAFSNHGPRFQNRGDGNSNRGQGQQNREGVAYRESDSSHEKDSSQI